eukprot:14033363-Alexandrium_andersonii.AAC.1
MTSTRAERSASRCTSSRSLSPWKTPEPERGSRPRGGARLAVAPRRQPRFPRAVPTGRSHGKK